MAEQLNLLHTYSRKWLNGFDINFPVVSKEQWQSKISNLKKLEEQFYRTFSNNKAHTYEEFMSIIRATFQTMDNNSQDSEVIKRFANVNLRNSLRKLEAENMTVYTENVTVTINTEGIKNFNLTRFIKDSQFDKNQIKVLGKDVIITDVALSKRAGRTIARAYNARLKKEAHSSEAVTRELTKQLRDGALSFQLNDNFIEPADFETSWDVKAKNFPWGYTAKDMEKLKNSTNQIELKKEIDLAIETVHNYILYTLGAGASPKMKKAIEKTWDDIMKNEGFSFFSKGFLNSVIGALGEFQVALLTNYFALTSGIEDTIKANIVADTTVTNMSGNKTSEKAKTDVEIFNQNEMKWGIQVKNINEFLKNGNEYTDFIGTNIHPDKFADAVSQSNPKFSSIKDAFLTFVANYAFNETFATGRDGYFERGRMREGKGAGLGAIIYSEFQQFAIQEVGALLNLAINKENIDKVTFYVIAGNSLIPASMLIQTVWDTYNTDHSILKTPTIISKSLVRQTDSEFHRNLMSIRTGKKKNKEGKVEEVTKNLVNYSTYWDGTFGDEDSWSPTPENEVLFKKLISSGIRIDSGFRYKDLLEKTKIFAESYIKLT